MENNFYYKNKKGKPIYGDYCYFHDSGEKRYFIIIDQNIDNKISKNIFYVKAVLLFGTYRPIGKEGYIWFDTEAEEFSYNAIYLEERLDFNHEN